MTTITTPALVTPTAGLQAAGTGSGLNVGALVSQLMSAEQQPLTQLQAKATSYQTEISNLGTIQSAVTQLETAAQGLTSATSTPAYSAQTSSPAFTATASGTATPGNYSISISKLAQTQEVAALGIASASTAIGGGSSTTLTINLGSISGGTFNSTTGQYSGATFTAGPGTPVQITIDNTNNTLQGISNAINAAHAGVTASIVNDGSATPYRLVLTSTATGLASSMQIAVSGDATLQGMLSYDPQGTQNLAQVQVAQNAQLNVNGINISSSSNTVTGAVSGLTLNLTQQTTATAQLTVSTNPAPLTNAINALVTAYNSVQKTISGLTGQGGAMQGDPNVMLMQRQLQSALSSMTTNSGIYNSLATVNVTLQKDGTLAVDATKLSAQLSSNFNDVSAVVAAFGQSLNTLTNSILDPTTGPIQNEINGVNAEIQNNTSQQTQLTTRFAADQARYQAQFAALDVMMTNMQSTSSFLQRQFYYQTPTNSSGG